MIDQQVKSPTPLAGTAREQEVAAKVLSLIRQTRDGALKDSQFGRRMRGTGPIAALLKQRFAAGCRRHALNRQSEAELDTTKFSVPAGPGTQLDWLGPA